MFYVCYFVILCIKYKFKVIVTYLTIQNFLTVLGGAQYKLSIVKFI